MQGRIPTREEARAELARRQAEEASLNYGAKAPQATYSSEDNDITPLQATAKSIPTREEARAELARRQEEAESNESIYSKIGKLPISVMKDAQSGALMRNLISGGLTGLQRGGELAGEGMMAIPGMQSLANKVQNKTGVSYKPEDIKNIFAGIGTGNSPASELERGIGSYLPYGVAGGASLLGQIVAGAAHGAALAEPGQENLFGYLPPGRGGAALGGAGLNLATGLGGKLLEALRPSKMFRGNLSPEELQANVEATKGTTTGLGDVIGSPTLKQSIENEIADMPFSGVKQRMQGTAKQIQDQADKIASDLKLDEVTNVDLHQALKEASNKAKNEKNSKFAAVNNEADKLGVKVGRDNFSQVAADELTEINASPELQAELPKDFIESLERYAENKEGNTLKRTDIFRGVLGDKANEYFRAGKDNLAGVMARLKQALVDDREAAIQNSGHPTLKAMNDEAHKFYKENYAPFKHPDITKFTREGGDSDLLLPHFLKKGQNDRSVLLSRLTEQLKSGSSQNLPSRLYLSKAMEAGKADPRKLAKLYNDLGENQRETLIPDKNLRKRLDNYSRLVGLNSEPLDLMRNPKTGFRGVQSAIHTLLGIGGYASGGPLGAAAGVILPGVAMRPAVKALTNQDIRESLVNEMLKNRTRFANPRKILGTQTLTQGLMSALQQGNE